MWKHTYEQKVLDRDSCCSVTKSCPHLGNPIDCSTPGFPFLHHLLDLLNLMPIELVMPSTHLILCCPLLLMPSIFPSIRAFSNELSLHTSWPNYRSFNFSISPMNIQGWFPLALTGLNSLKLVFWTRNLRYDHTPMIKNWKKNPTTLGDKYI